MLFLNQKENFWPNDKVKFHYHDELVRLCAA
jgi:hypothetical protein